MSGDEAVEGSFVKLREASLAVPPNIAESHSPAASPESPANHWKSQFPQPFVTLSSSSHVGAFKNIK